MLRFEGCIEAWFLFPWNLGRFRKNLMTGDDPRPIESIQVQTGSIHSWDSCRIGAAKNKKWLKNGGGHLYSRLHKQFYYSKTRIIFFKHLGPSNTHLSNTLLFLKVRAIGTPIPPSHPSGDGAPVTSPWVSGGRWGKRGRFCKDYEMGKWVCVCPEMSKNCSRWLSV